MQPIVIAHRGASGYRPEHSRSAYELAIRMGADAVEPDVVPTRDGVLVIRHENEISGTTDIAEHPEFRDRRTTKTVDGVRASGWFTEDFTWEELRTLRTRERLPELRPGSAAFDGTDPIMRLDELLRLLDGAPRPVGVVVEIKHATFFAAAGFPMSAMVDELLGTAGWRSRDRLTVESFEKTPLRELRRRGNPGKLVYLLEHSGRAADEVAAHGADAADYRSERDDASLAVLARELDGISIALKTLMAGVATVTVDDPAPVRSPIVDRAHAVGLDVFTWTLRPENRFLPRALRHGGDPAAYGDWERWYASAIRTGIDGVFADHTDLAVRTRDAIDA